MLVSHERARCWARRRGHDPSQQRLHAPTVVPRSPVALSSTMSFAPWSLFRIMKQRFSSALLTTGYDLHHIDRIGCVVFFQLGVSSAFTINANSSSCVNGPREHPVSRRTI
jgi:hypothetical protein